MANRPFNSLVSILLPWHHQTLASKEQRKIVLETIKKDFPNVAWKLSLNLFLRSSFTSDTQKPKYRHTIPDNWELKVSKQDYYDLVTFYFNFSLEMTINDFDKLYELLKKIDKIPNYIVVKFMENLNSLEVGKLSKKRKIFDLG